MTAIGRWWPVALLLAVFGATILALARCAVAEIVTRLSVRLYTTDADERRLKREEWLRILEDMASVERPGHAGSLLWAGVRRVPARICHGVWYRLGYSRGQCEVILLLRAYCDKDPLRRMHRATLHTKLFVHPSLGGRMISSLADELPVWARGT